MAGPGNSFDGHVYGGGTIATGGSHDNIRIDYYDRAAIKVARAELIYAKFADAKTQKRNNELIRYRELKEEAESEGKKFISAPAEKEAQIYVAEYRKIRNALQAYVDACKVGIGSCQSIVKYKSEEKKYLGAE